jgi:hypothetical protein
VAADKEHDCSVWRRQLITCMNRLARLFTPFAVIVFMKLCKRIFVSRKINQIHTVPYFLFLHSYFHHTASSSLILFHSATFKYCGLVLNVYVVVPELQTPSIYTRLHSPSCSNALITFMHELLKTNTKPELHAYVNKAI